MKYHSEIIKLSTLPDGELHPQGAAMGGPIFEGYTVKGYHEKMPVIGESFVIKRYERNGERIWGIMTTSTIDSVIEFDSGIIQFQTKNSIYRLKKLDPNTQNQ